MAIVSFWCAGEGEKGGAAEVQGAALLQGSEGNTAEEDQEQKVSTHFTIARIGGTLLRVV